MDTSTWTKAERDALAEQIIQSDKPARLISEADDGILFLLLSLTRRCGPVARAVYDELAARQEALQGEVAQMVGRIMARWTPPAPASLGPSLWDERR